MVFLQPGFSRAMPRFAKPLIVPESSDQGCAFGAMARCYRDSRRDSGAALRERHGFPAELTNNLARAGALIAKAME